MILSGRLLSSWIFAALRLCHTADAAQGPGKGVSLAFRCKLHLRPPYGTMGEEKRADGGYES